MSRTGSFSCFLVVFLVLSTTPIRSETFTFAVGEWPPYISSQMPGLGSHTETVKRIFNHAGVDLEFEFLPWQRSMEMTRNGTFPATFSWSYTSERADSFYYSTLSIDKIRYVHFYRKDRFPDGLDALNFGMLQRQGLTVVAVKNYWYDQPLREAKVKVHFVVTEEQAWSMLRHKRADIYIESLRVGEIQKREFLGPDAGLIAHTGPFREVPMFILFSKAHPAGQKLLKLWEAYAALN